MDRRTFLVNSGLLTAAAAVSPALTSCEKRKSIPSGGDVDVLVVGGGPGGVCAAIAAARLGVRVMILDSGNCLGGMATKGLIGPFMTCYDRYGEEQIIKGLFGEIVDRLVENGWAIDPAKVRWQTPYSAWIKAGHDHVTPFEPEGLKYLLDVMVAEAGVKVLYHAFCLDVVKKGNNISKVTVVTKEGLKEISSKIVIDATGDGDVAFKAGVPCDLGNPERDGAIQPTSLFFRIGHVDSAALEADVQKHLPEFRRVNNVSYRALHWNVAEAEANGEWDLARKSVNLFKSVKDDEWVINCSRVRNINPTESESLTSGEIEGRRQVQGLMHFFRKYVAGCKDAVLLCSASTLGIRESRHLHGHYILKAEDLISGITPEDSIALASNSVDVHGGGDSPSSSVYTVINAKWYGIPYRSLVPLGVDNLLLAGRDLSATSDAAGAVRVMPPAMAMGQAAGVAAALSVSKGVAPANLDFSDIKDALLKQNVFLG